MEKEKILTKLNELKKGAYVKLTKIKVFDNEIIKETDMVIRLGVDYANMKVNLDKVVGPLPWGQWLEGFEGLVIEHKGQLYLRVADSYTNHNKSTYKQNGNEITKEQATALLGEKKLASHPSSVYNIKFDNIVNIG